ncbi:hypothetical protein MmTuc01_2555 [Methanosarcina mazei Tuc01]|jgi:hypothetical protein|uniref:Uncharacterized protein n=1 Tax=Methanosarcina mazei Tuc01 TaxID=1236903 RepID=M1PBE7_METMZ|nr:hypothetical protein MmTuc01_2555 [Methanosarcina mazei Tuc01]
MVPRHRIKEVYINVFQTSFKEKNLNKKESCMKNYNQKKVKREKE